MNELTPGQIAASIAGHPLSGWPELRLLMLFLAEDGREVVVRPMPLSEPLATAA
jgi:hypothetical protein